MFKKIKINQAFLLSIIGILSFTNFNEVSGKNPSATKKEYMTTDAGDFDFSYLSQVKFPGAFHHLTNYVIKDGTIELDDGSMWTVAKTSVIQQWNKTDTLVITQNHLTFSIYRFCILNLDQKLAVPASITREPLPDSNNKNVYMIKKVDRAHDLVVLDNGQQWSVHGSDYGTLSKFNDHDRVVIGLNASDSNAECPCILMDTAANTYVRVSLIK